MLNSPVLQIEDKPNFRPVSNLLTTDQRFGASLTTPFKGPSPQIANDVQPEITSISKAAKVLLSEYSMHLAPGLRSGLLAQTNVVFDTDDWEDDDALPSLDSYRCMLKGLIEISPKERPFLSVSEQGNLISAWYCDQARTMFEFRPQGKIYWVIAIHNGNDVDRSTGIEAIEKIRAISQTHGAFLG